MNTPVAPDLPGRAGCDARFRLAWACLDEADALSAAAFQRRSYRTWLKSDGSPTVDVETAIERMMTERIRRAFPGDSVLGEELGLVHGTPSRWVVDPIDGTSSFIEGVPIYAHMLAHLRAGEAIFALVSAPLLGRRWWAYTGQGAFQGSQRITVSRVRGISQARLGYGGLRDYDEAGGLVRLARSCMRSRGFGNFLPHMLVAEGIYDLASSGIGCCRWDVAPLELIVSAAGGRLTSFDGRPWRGSEPVLTSNRILHPEAIAIITRAGPEALRTENPGAAAGTSTPRRRSARRTERPGKARG